MVAWPRASTLAAVVGVVGAVWLAVPSVDAQVKKVDPADVASVRVSFEVAPPGSIAQMKIELTEPKPITTGRAELSWEAFDEFAGITLGPGDAAGIAVVEGGHITLSIFSPSGTFGLASEYPLLTIAGRVPEVPLSTLFPMKIARGTLKLTGPGGIVYRPDIKQGALLVDGTLSVGDVIPGHGDLSPGTRVSIVGSGFTPDTRVQLDDTSLAEVDFVDETQLQIVLDEAASIQGKELRVRNRAEVKYHAYTRTRALGSSAHPLLSNVVPLFPPSTTFLTATVSLAPATIGLALQNLEATDAFVSLELLDETGAPVASSFITVPPESYAVRDIVEVFGVAGDRAPAAVVRLAASSPIQVLGVDVDESGAVTPRLPQ